jgi:hypothetical protein
VRNFKARFEVSTSRYIFEDINWLRGRSLQSTCAEKVSKGESWMSALTCIAEEGMEGAPKGNRDRWFSSKLPHVEGSLKHGAR